eukprot:2629042-Amphidinium_carterae.1
MMLRMWQREDPFGCCGPSRHLMEMASSSWSQLLPQTLTIQSATEVPAKHKNHWFLSVKQDKPGNGKPHYCATSPPKYPKNNYKQNKKKTINIEQFVYSRASIPMVRLMSWQHMHAPVVRTESIEVTARSRRMWE